MQQRLICFLCLCVVGLVMIGSAQAENYLDRLRMLDEKGQEAALFKALLQTKNQDDFIHALDFLKEKIVDQRTHESDFYAVYSILLWRAGVKESAAAMAAATLLILYADQARCADKSAGYMRITNRFSLFQEMLEYLRAAPAKAKDEMMAVAMDMEARLKDRPPNRALCYTGMETTEQALAYAEENDIELERSGEDSYVIPDFDHINPEYISEAQWHQRRGQLREEFPTYFEAETAAQ